MAISVLDAGSVTRSITGMKGMDGATLRPVLRAKVMDADGVTLRTVAEFASPLSLSIFPAGLFGVANSSGDISVTTNSAVATPAGGLAPYTYAWTVLSDTNPDGAVTALSATSATTAARMTNVGAYETFDAVLRCTVTDAASQTAQDDIPAQFINDGPFA